MKEEAKQYLNYIITPLLRDGFELLEDFDEHGILFIIVPKTKDGFSIIIGKEGRTIHALRRVIDMWRLTNWAAMDSIRLFVPDPKKIEHA